MNHLLQIKNDGTLIVQTNFWETEFNERGLYYLSGNAGAYRLLVPDAHFKTYPEMQTAKEVVITKGVDRLQKREMVEIMFDDHTESPFTLYLPLEQTDNRTADDKPEGRPFDVYLEGCFLVASFKCHCRRAKHLPCLKPWKV
jgi:hypothetical protein